MNVQESINKFLALNRFAFVGVSRQAGEFSRGLFHEFLRRGYDAVPVNPHADEIDGRKCFERIADLRPPVSAAFILVPSYTLTPILLDCAEAGLNLIWIHGISGPKDVSAPAIRFCEERGIGLIPGYCPFMFLEKAAFFHRMHGFVWKAVGMYPK